MRTAGVSTKEVRARWGEAELSPDAVTRLRELERSVGLSVHPPGQTIEEANLFYTELCRKHGLGAPRATYPVLENALRVKLGRTVPEQQAAAASIFAEFSKVAAADKEHAWFATAYTPKELGSESTENRRICHPFYLKRLNSVMAVDMSAAVLIMSAGEARRRGVPREKWIFLHGCSEANDRLEILERPSLCASPAIKHAGSRALAMAGVQDINREVDFLDIYSCFPVAVQVACAELGLSLEGGKPLTLTGGLPYHGGPGSNYVTHAIAAAAEKLRQQSGRVRALVTANGGYLTKHAFGVYANFPDKAAMMGTWSREDPAICQAAVDAEPCQPVAEAPTGGIGTVETYCVRLGRDGRPELGIVIGKLDDGRRFVANTPPEDAEMLRKFVDGDLVGATGLVTCSGGKSTFHLHGNPSRL